MNKQQFFYGFLIIAVLFCLYSCDRTNYVFKVAQKAKSIETSNVTNDNATKNETLVAIMLTNNGITQTENKISAFEALLNNETLDVELLRGDKGKLTFFTYDKDLGVYEVENTRQFIKAVDLNIDANKASFSHLTTYKGTPVEIITYNPDGSLLRTVDRAIGVIIVSTIGRYPGNLTF